MLYLIMTIGYNIRQALKLIILIHFVMLLGTGWGSSFLIPDWLKLKGNCVLTLIQRV